MKLSGAILATVCMLSASLTTGNASDLLDELSSPPGNLFEVTDASATTSASDSAIQQCSFEGACGSCGSSGEAGCGSSCSAGCDGGCGCGCAGSSCPLTGLFDTIGSATSPLGITLKSDRCFDRFIEPVTNSVFFEDPRSRTRLRFLFINQQVPQSTPVLGDTDAQVFGLEATFALTERLSIIAQKDGWINIQSDGIGHQDGWANLATGLKYVLIRDVENQFLLSGGFQYEWTNGSSEVFQGNGDGVWTPFLSVGKEFNCDTHFIGVTGFHLAADNADSSSWYYSLHVDHAITDKLYGLIEMNGLHYIDDGTRLPADIEGGDLLNLGSTTAEGNYLMTMAFGGTYKINQNWETAAAYEIPLAGKGDIFDDRFTFTLSFIY